LDVEEISIVENPNGGKNIDSWNCSNGWRNTNN
jgi:hypothetical protein